MNQKQIRAAVEAMLFAAADPISADKLAQAVQLPQAGVEAALEDLRTRYQREDSGLCLLHLDTRWQLSTKAEWADCIRRLLDARRAVPLGPAAMETLTVIAYNQPVSGPAGPPGQLPYDRCLPTVLWPVQPGGPASGAQRGG